MDTSDIVLTEDILKLSEFISKNTHEVWSQNRMNDGWTYGEERDDAKKHHPCLIPYEDLPESEKEYDRHTSLQTLKLIIKLGYKIVKEE
jgi:ryanodine receptor 2